ncbi:hypothetical protein COP2_035136 [Malus domestica]
MARLCSLATLLTKASVTLTTVKDEYSRAMLGEQLGKGSGQSVPDRKFDFRGIIGGKEAKYFERLRWECPLRYEEWLSIFTGLPVCGGWR